MGLFDKLRGSAQASTAAIDPVCKMRVEPAKAAGKSEHGGKTYHFCSASCKRQFDADPHKFLDAHAH
jgi:Cu+-exporting ATPase